MDEVAVHGNHDLLVIVLHSLQRRKLPCAGFGGVHVVGDLDISFLVHLRCDEVNLLFTDLADSHLITTPQQFKINDVFQNVSHIAAPVS